MKNVSYLPLICELFGSLLGFLPPLVKKIAVAIGIAMIALPATSVGQERGAPNTLPWGNHGVMSEQLHKRDRNTKHFANRDGTASAFISPGSIHYLEGNTWCDINNVITDNKGAYSETHPFANTANAFRNYFPANPFSDAIITEYKEARFYERIISIDFADVNGALISSVPVNMSGIHADVAGNTITYSHAIAGAEIIYTLKNDRRKFDLKILSPAFLANIPPNAKELVVREEVALNQAFETEKTEHGISLYINGEHLLRYAVPVSFDNNSRSAFSEQRGDIRAFVNGNTILLG
jgi:hypothetical protein